MALTGVTESSARIHFGISGSIPPCGRPRHCLAASCSSSAPPMILIQLAAVDGAPLSVVAEPPATASTIPPTIAIPTTHPSRNAGPLERPLGVASISTIAMIGSGDSATPTP